MSDADRERSSGEREPARAMTRRTRQLIRRTIEVIPFILALIGAVLLFDGLDAFHVVGALGGIALAFAVIFLLLEGPDLPKLYIAALLAFFISQVGYAT